MRYYFVIYLFIFGCSPQKNVGVESTDSAVQNLGSDTKKDSPGDSPSQSSDQEIFPSSLELLSEHGLAPLEDVSSLRLKSSSFRVIAVRANLQDFVDGPTPTISIQTPEQADYVQILRCPENLEIVGGPAGEELSQVLLGNAIDEEEVFNRNDFWGAAIDAGCKRIAKFFSDRVFLDGAAPSGKWVYLARACVLQRRLNAAEGFSSDGCSPFVNASTPLEFKSEREYRLRTMLEEEEKIKGELDQVWANYRDLLTRSSEAFDRCAKQSFDGAIKGNERRKKLGLLVNAIPAGIGLLAGGRAMYKNLASQGVSAGTKVKGVGNNALKWAGASLGTGYIGFTVLSGAIKDGSEFDGQTCAEAVALDEESVRVGQLMDQYNLQGVRYRDEIDAYKEQLYRVK